jgi:WD40 repeat protein
MKKSLQFLIAIYGLWMLNGCGAGAPPPPTPVATHFSVASSTPTPTAGIAFNITVTALDASGGVVTGYSGKVTFSSTDTQAVLPPANSALPNGTGTFAVTLKTAIGQTITVTDAVGALTGTSNPINVSPGATTKLNVVNPPSATAAIPFSLTVTAVDALGNTAIGYAGMVHFSSNDGQAVLPPNSALASGVGNFSATLKTVANSTITATDTSTATITGSSTPISVLSNAATHFAVATPGTASTRATISINVSALDGAENIAAAYSGKVHLTSSDANAKLPADGPLTNGVGNFSVTLETAGNQTITATDTVTASLSKASNPIAVAAAAGLAINPAAPPNGTVGSNYGQNKTEIFECFGSRGGRIICNPCTSSFCASLPLCVRNFAVLPCREMRQVFTGFTFTATGGVPPYSWSASSLPPGLVMNSQNGEITGTPTPASTTAGTYNVVVTVNDSGTPPAPISSTFPIVIKNPPPPVVNATPAPPTGVINQPYSFTFTASAGLPPYQNWSETGALPLGIAPLTSGGVLSGTPAATAVGSFPITVTVQDSLGQNSAPQNFTLSVFAHGFRATGSMVSARGSHTATLLNNGKVLVAGGADANGNAIATAELFDPSTGTFSATGSMITARAHFAATLLSSGKVLVTGGLDPSGNPLATAEIYDPNAGTFSATTGVMKFVHASHTATLVNTGMVLVAGWGNATAELFDPATGTFAATGSMVTARVSHTATLLSNGQVLVTGGIQGSGTATTVLTEAELYDPGKGTFSATAGVLTTARDCHTASLLSDGKVLVTGGLDSTGKAIATAELYDPTNQSFTLTKGSMETARAFQTATSLKDGTVLVTGGTDGTSSLATAELYDPNTGIFSPTGNMANVRQNHTATLLNNGTVLVTGGNNGAALASAELYQ